ncbi:BglG family transcription antiterminator [Breznakia sp. OttesenSCG-928-G09]|nr:BglG family transcription antiterminator [Breznakia sp. OttesenSCG-928-G09]
MMVFSSRFIEIIQLLYEYQDYSSANELATQLGISAKTVSRTINMYEQDQKEIRKSGFHIEAKQGYGYLLVIDDKHQFEEFKNHQFKALFRINNDEKQEREIAIIQILLGLDDQFIMISDIADQLYVSDATISSDLKNVRHLVQRFGLEIENKTSKGIRIAGSEMSLRLCYSKYMMNQDKTSMLKDFEYTEEEYRHAETIILNTLQTYQVQMSDASREHLVNHILISVHRMEKGYFITFDEEEVKVIMDTREYSIAKSIVTQLKEFFVILDAEEEIIYIAIQLLGKRSLSGKNQQYQLAKDIEEILGEIFDEINTKLAIDLKSDVEVFNYLAMHFEPMLTRLKYGIKSNNPFVDEVKSQQATSFEMGLIAKKIILDNYNYNLDDNEVSYLAMYFSLALDRLKYIQKPKNILVVCGLGVCSSRILVYKLRQQYGDYINDILTCQIHELRTISMKHFDCVISTINKPIATNLPVIYIDDFLSDLKDKELDAFFLNNKMDMFHIEDYLKKDLFFYADPMNNEEEAIEFIINKLKEKMTIPPELKTNILEREKLSSTAFGNYSAIPHPVKMCTEETIFAVLMLSKSMIWGKKKVKCIFFLSPSKKSPGDLRHFNEALAKFILNPKLFARFSKSTDFETLHAIFSEINNI